MKHVPAELAAHAAGVSAATIRKWVQRGKLTRHRDGFDLNELLACVDSRDFDALLSRAGIKPEDRPACRLQPP